MGEPLPGAMGQTKWIFWSFKFLLGPTEIDFAFEETPGTGGRPTRPKAVVPDDLPAVLPAAPAVLPAGLAAGLVVQGAIAVTAAAACADKSRKKKTAKKTAKKTTTVRKSKPVNFANI